MKKSLRIISMLLVLVMCFSFVLTSCGNTEDETPDTPSTDTPDVPDTPGVSEHTCESKCETCGGCTDAACIETACATKCEGHEPPVEDEYQLPLEDGYNQLTLYWNNKKGVYDNCDIWLWFPGADGRGHTFHECGYGGKVVINVPQDVTEVGFIVRTGCSDPGGTSWGTATKDGTDSDRFAIIEGRETVIYLKSGDQYQYTSNDGGKTLVQIKKLSMVGIINSNEISFSVTPSAKITDFSQIRITDGENEIPVVSVSPMGRLSGQFYVKIDGDFDLSKIYSIEVDGYGSAPIVPTKIFDSEYFADTYHYDGNDLGAVINGDNTTFKVWAPTASKVVLNLFEAGNDCDAYKTVEMVRGEKGVWSHTEACGHGTYYTYTVTTSVGTQEAVDPYAKAAGVNGKRGMVVDLSLTNPNGWNTDTYRTDIKSYSEAIIWEVHVRDFSNKLSEAQNKGKYLAFTERGLVNADGIPVGVDYLVDLGITHVHLLPVYDYASVDETKNNQFNWGYDPQNYNVPEGSYSTDPYNGEVRIKEFKQMVQALHDAGIGVIMDVVYNHTYDANSNLNKIVPYYYYRYTATGANSSASGCGNDTASERYMFGKYMVDSTSYWMEEYHLDGFRFDLMGLHDIETMQEVESAVHTINPNAIIYGEGWSMTTISGAVTADQKNISKINPTGDAIGGIAVFNDTIRDALKGSVFDTASQGYINGNATSTNLKKILFSMNGGNDRYFGQSDAWIVKNSMVINYMSAHDNNTLWDKLILSVPGATEDQLNQMNNLGAAIIMVSKGTPFWQAGEEMLRTKPLGNGEYDHNSYMSSDEVNNIDWSVLDGESRQYNTMLYYRGLIELRKTYGIFGSNDTVLKYSELSNGGAAVRYGYLDENGEFVAQALVVINPSETNLTYFLSAEWNLVADSERAGSEVLAKESGMITVDSIGIRVYVNDALLGK